MFRGLVEERLGQLIPYSKSGAALSLFHQSPHQTQVHMNAHIHTDRHQTSNPPQKTLTQSSL